MVCIILTGVGVVALCPCAVFVLNGTGKLFFGLGSVIVVAESIDYFLSYDNCTTY